MNFLAKAKHHAQAQLRPCRSIIASIVYLFLIHIGYTQSDTLTNTSLDTLSLSQQDTLSIPGDTLTSSQDSTVKRKGDITTTINYSARDSILASIDGRIIWLYGNAQITYGGIKLEAEEIMIDYANNTLTAHGRRDSLGQRIGYPIFTNGPEVYETKDITYNFKTGKAKITEVVTQQGEGYLHGDAVFKNENNELFSLHSSYTTCNLEHPHYRIIASKSKAIPDDKIVAGPFYLEFEGVPTPLGFLFGMFPAQRESSSGIVFPSYDEGRLHGFSLRRGGYFFDISDYLKLTVTGDVYSKGGSALYTDMRYSKRYAYTGSLGFAYTRNRIGTKIEDPTVSNDYKLTWSHTPASVGRTSRFSANVSAATSTYRQYNNLFYGEAYDPSTTTFDNTARKLTSSISYSKTFPGTPISLGLNMSHNQDLVTNRVDLTLPTLNLNVRNIYPFQSREGIRRAPVLDNFNFRYTMTAVNRVTNVVKDANGMDSVADFSFADMGSYLQEARKGMRHEIPISTSFKMLKYVTASPSFSYQEIWYDKKLNWTFNDKNQPVVSDTVNGFSRISNYNFGFGMSTRVYGIYNFKKGNLKAIRHVMNPTISFGYQPDFSNPELGYYQKLVNLSGATYYKSRYEGFAYGGSSAAQSGSIGLSLNNNLEAKVRAPTDSVARKVNLLNNLSVSTSYNMVADSFKLADVRFSANTNLFQNALNVNMGASMSPYVIEDGKRIDEYAILHGGFGQITTANLSMGMNLNPDANKKDQASREKIEKSELPQEEKEYYLQNPNSYIDFEIPWNLRVNFNLNYSNPITGKRQLTENLSANGDLAMTEKWKVGYNASYDFEKDRFARLDFSINRDLHCWTLSFYWIPLGRFQSYNLTIRVKASILQDLKIEKRKSFYDNL